MLGSASVHLCLSSLKPPISLHFNHTHALLVSWNPLTFHSFGSLLRLDWAASFFKWLASSQPVELSSHVAHFKKPSLSTLPLEGQTEVTYHLISFFDSVAHTIDIMYIFSGLCTHHLSTLGSVRVDTTSVYHFIPSMVPAQKRCSKNICQINKK